MSCLDLTQPSRVLDDPQFVPELLSALKRRVDHLGFPGHYFPTGFRKLGIVAFCPKRCSNALVEKGKTGIYILPRMLDKGLGGSGCYSTSRFDRIDVSFGRTNPTGIRNHQATDRARRTK
jgi:hypothetical protein